MEETNQVVEAIADMGAGDDGARQLAGPYSEFAFVTIDAESTKDIDDAVHTSQLPEGGYRVLVAIADPTGLVKPGSTEDEAAKLLGATAYARDRAIKKMLPARISEEKGSLVAGLVRRVMVMDIGLSDNLDPTSFTIVPAEIRVAHRLSYSQIPSILGAEDNGLRPMLSVASSLCRLLLHKRRKSGALALYDLARMVLTDEEGRLIQLHSVDEMVGHIIVQELMVLANTLVAGYMVNHNIPGIFRNHVPKLAAPKSDELASTIEAWLSAGAMDVEYAREKFHAIAGKAVYGAKVNGHYALSLPFYAHATSPLRRYADLVNIRQLKAFLQKKDLPHSMEELGPLADALTEAMARRKDERSEGFKEAVRGVAERALGSEQAGRLERLADHEIVQAIKLARGAGELPGMLVDELARRLDRSIVTDKVTDCLLAELPRSLWPPVLKAAFGRWMHLVPTRAMHLLVHGEQIGFFAKVNIEATGEGTSFQARAVIVMSDGGEFSGAGGGARKRDAEQEAALRAVAAVLGLGLELPSHAMLPKPAVGAARGNPKGTLLELCQKHGWSSPAYSVTGQGPSHAMIFSGQATMLANGRTLRAETARGANKKDAESVLSADLLAQVKVVLQPKVVSVAAAPKVGEVAPSSAAPSSSDLANQSLNPIGALQERAQKHKLKSPEYLINQTQDMPPSFLAKVTVFQGTPKQFEGRGGTKQDAKKAAAQAALAGLSTR